MSPGLVDELRNPQLETGGPPKPNPLGIQEAEMSADEVELARRTRVALDAIRKSLGTEAGEFGATLFASHHLGELEASYWQARLQNDRPAPSQVLELLELQAHWGDDDEDGIDTLDFGLPDGVSNYLLSVSFDENGEVEEIVMES